MGGIWLSSSDWMGEVSVLLADTGSQGLLYKGGSEGRTQYRHSSGQLLHEGWFAGAALYRHGHEALVSINVSPVSYRGPLFIGAFFSQVRTSQEHPICTTINTERLQISR